MFAIRNAIIICEGREKMNSSGAKTLIHVFQDLVDTMAVDYHVEAERRICASVI